MSRVHLLIAAFLSFLSICSPAIALEMSSKRNCAICHVMWLNDFRTDKETLIEWQPGNVLMKDTQGVVSSEDMCYSCHDGYVMDSRHETWKFNGHKTFVKPSQKVAIPPGLPLSNKNELYCGTCHSPHGGGANTDASISGPITFLRKDNIDSQMCETCHLKQTAFARYNSHPLKTAAFDIPKTLFHAGSRRSKSKNKVICQTCHQVHGAKGEHITVLDNRDSALCTTCHTQQSSLLQTQHDLRVSLPKEQNIKGQTPADSGPCGACHLAHDAAGKMLWAKKRSREDPPSQLCLSCHGQDSGSKIAHIGKYSHPVEVTLSSKGPAGSELPLFQEIGVRDPAGKVQCFTCHNVHRWDPNNIRNTGGKDVQGDPSTSFLRISSSGSSDLCIECHQDKEPLLTSDHNLEVTAPEEKNVQERPAHSSGPCGACHLPHNAAGLRLWAKPLAAEKEFTSALCVGCHNKTGAAKEKLVGNNSHPIEVTLKKSTISPGLERSSTELPLYSKEGDKTPTGIIACTSCHDPHRWTPGKSEPLEDYTRQNMEGNAANSFLRKANFPSPELCEVCHLTKGRVDGTTHDLREKLPAAKDQSVKPSGLCESCHLVHNAPNSLKLWARPYGPNSGNDNPMDRLCTSCHSKGQVAEKSTPVVATHPPGKLITNVIRFSQRGTRYTPIFGANGEEKSVGNLSCPSCHNAHQWSPLSEEAGSGVKSAGNSVRSFRFLRTMSYNAVCRECHGPEAIFRYQYFHVQEKRSSKF